MDTLCKSVYDPLFLFINPLHRAFPVELQASYDKVVQCRQNLDWSLISTLSVGCTKELLVACLNQDEDTMFSEHTTNPLILFIGGREVYDRLATEEERASFWGSPNDRYLETIIRQCMLLSAITPLKSKLKSVVDKLSSPGSNGFKDPSSIISQLSSDPDILPNIMSLMDSSDSVNELTSSLKQMLEGIMVEKDTIVIPQEKEEPEKDKDQQEEDSSLLEMDAMISPGAFLKSTRRKDVPKTTTAKNPLSELFDMVPQMTPEDYTDFSKDMQGMSADEMKEMVTGLTGLLGGGGEGGNNPMDMLKAFTGGKDLSELMKHGNPMDLLKTMTSGKGI
jgi:hypothetical protein